MTDLLQAREEPGDGVAYLSISYNVHSNSTTIYVRPAGASGGQQIVLMGVDLTSSGALTGDNIIQRMLSGHAQPHG